MLTPADLTTMTPRALCSGLMRGNASEHKLGYTAASAALAVRDTRDLPDDELAHLMEYARGFSAGMRDAIARDDPDRLPDAPTTVLTVLDGTHRAHALGQDPANPDYNAGYADGISEHGTHLLPSFGR